MRGWKTYLAGGLMILWGAYGLFTGKLEANEAIKNITEGLGIIGIGHKLDKSSRPDFLVGK